MKKNTLTSKLQTGFALAGAAFTQVIAQVYAQELPGVTNPVLPKLGSNPDAAASGATFSSYFVTIWRALIVVGGLAVLFNLVNGAIEWITAGGEKSKVEHARQKMTQGIVGMILLVGSFAIVSFVSSIFGFNLLKATIPTPQDQSTQQEADPDANPALRQDIGI